jgi:hypothetical protein
LCLWERIGRRVEWVGVAESKRQAKKITADDGIIHVGFTLRLKLKIYAYPPKKTNGKLSIYI